MKLKPLLLVTSLISCFITLHTAFAGTPSKQLFAYFTDWGVYERNFQPEKIQINDVTGIVYAFAEVGNCARPYATDDNPTLCNASGTYGTATGVQDYKLYSADAYADFNIIPSGYKHEGENGLGTIAKVLTIAHAQHKPVLLSIGGWSLSVPLRTAMDAQHRTVFIQSIIDFLNSVKMDTQGDGFDGIDIDFEPNNWDIITAQNIADYAQFLQALRQALQSQYRHDALVTIATWANPDVVQKIGLANWKMISDSVDYVNVMTYDYHAGWDNPKITNFLAPLSFDSNQPDNVMDRTTFNANATIQAYLNNQVPANKILFGFPAYGRAVSGVPNLAPTAYPNAYGLYQSFTGTPNGEWEGDPGLFDYKYILQHMLGQGFTDYEVVGTAAAYNANLNNGTFISYDDVNNIRTKAKYVEENHLAGMMVWELSCDFNPKDSSPDEYNAKSLVHAASEALK